MYIIILYKSFEKLKRKYIPISWNIPPLIKREIMTRNFPKLMKTINLTSMKLKKLHTQETRRKQHQRHIIIKFLKSSDKENTVNVARGGKKKICYAEE